MTTLTTRRARAVHIAANLLESSNVAATVVDRSEGDLLPDLDTNAAHVVVEFGSLAGLAQRLSDAQERAQAAGDRRATVLVNGIKSARRDPEPIAVLTLADLAQLLGAIEDSGGSP